MAARRLEAPVALMAVLAATAGPAHAWIFHEHRRITSTAISGLEDHRAETFLRMWEESRAGRETRFCAEPGAARDEEPPSCLDFASWPAISGDHSCSPVDLLATVSDTDWIMKVAAIGARTGRELAEASTERQKNSVYVRSTLDLARADPAPGVRGAANNGHFQMNREGNDLARYLAAAVQGGAPLNSIGNYARHHLAALRLAAAWGAAAPSSEERARLARAALANEAFGLHFLEDSFAAGHVAGCWGRGAERLGTHDYYNEHGLETMTWGGENVILLGDRRMRRQDLHRTASAVRVSLAQLADAAAPGAEGAPGLAPASLEEAERSPFDVCKATVFPDEEIPGGFYPALQEIVTLTPMPGRGPGIASLPRSRAEVGSFISWVSGARVGLLEDHFDRDLDGVFVDGEVSLGLRAGAGFDALTGRTGDGLLFLQVGVANRQEKGPYYSSSNPTETLPGRTGVEIRLRAPFWLVPGDFILAGPVLAFTSRPKLKSMAITAANGGLIPWQRGMPFGEQGRIQFVLGREAGLLLHGQWGSDHYMMLTEVKGEPAPQMREVEVRSMEWEFPVLEYRAFHTFAARQAWTAHLQVGAGFDRVTGVEVLDEPDARTPDLRSRRFVYMRITVEVRHYF